MDTEDQKKPGRSRRATEQSAEPAASVLDLLAQASEHYAGALRADPGARKYLVGRGVGGAVAARYGLGYARRAWRNLGEVFEGVADADILATGLVVESGSGQHARRFDRFRDRIMFPIRDAAGVVVGFGGRTLGKDDPKYLNSPESAAFRKRELLYGLSEALPDIRRHNLAVVVEGYLDVVSVAQAGFQAVVGTLGTACSAAQVELLLEHTDQLVFCFDGDAPGRRAAARALSTVLPFATDSRQIRFAFLPDGEDPDSFVRGNPAGSFEDVVGSAVSIGLFLVNVISEGCDFSAAEGRAKCAAAAGGYWRSLPDGQVREDLLAFCSQLLKLPHSEVADIWLAGG